MSTKAVSLDTFTKSWIWRFVRFRPPVCWLRFIFLFICGDLKRVPVDTLTNLGAFSYSSNGWHPFTIALKEIDGLHNGFPTTDILSSFYQRFDATDSIGYLPVHHQESWSSIKICYQPPWSGGKTVRSSDDFEHWTGPKSTNDCRMIYDKAVSNTKCKQ
jgi:hypothetical protein